ncbi:SulP family inorganic anion transporter, partial [Pseudomonas aeruginosa]|nr:SulP family inorganic anion transporter [Pseudomonas aeruginosa]
DVYKRQQIPMAALVAVMIMVSIGTFRWDSIRNLRRYPLSTNLVMLVTVGVVLATHNLAFGVIAGVLLASLFFANRIGHYLDIDSQLSADGSHRHYQVTGQLFFASSTRFVAAFDLKEQVDQVIIDLRHAHLWDITAVAALDKVVLGLRQRGVTVDVLGLNAASATLVDRFGAHDKPGAVDLLSDH